MSLILILNLSPKILYFQFYLNHLHQTIINIISHYLIINLPKLIFLLKKSIFKSKIIFFKYHFLFLKILRRLVKTFLQ